MGSAAAQQELSRFGIGGSQIAAAAGLHPYMAPIELWLELTGQRAPFSGNDLTEWGLLIEPALRTKYERAHGVTLYVPPAPLYREDLPWARCSPDGLVLGVAGAWLRGFEAKNTGLRNAWRWGDDTDPDAPRVVPVEYECQCQWSMFVTDLHRWDLAVLIGGNDYREFVVDRDDEFIDLLVGEAHIFWDRVQRREPPPPDGSRAYRDFLRDRYPHAREEFKAATPEIEEMVAELRAVRATIAEAEDRKDHIENALRAFIADDAGVDTSIGRLTCRPRKGKPAWKAIAMEFAAELGMTRAEIEQEADSNREQGSRPLLVPRTWRK